MDGKCIALEAREGVGIVSFHGGVGFLRFSDLRLVCVLFSGPSLLERKFFQKHFPPSFCSFFGGEGF